MATVQAKAGHATRSRFSSWRRTLDGRAWGPLSFVAFIALWQLVVSLSAVNPILLPAPGSVVTQFFESISEGLLWSAVVQTLQPLAIGLVLALVVGVIAGLVIGASSWLDLVTGPYLWGLFATPRIALAPLFVLWMGFGTSTKVMLVFLSAVLPVTLSCKEGVQTVDESLVKAAHVFGARRVDLFKNVVIPYTLPFIANGIRNGIARGFVGVLIIEMTVGSGGIGTQVIRSMRTFNTARMFAFVAVLVVTALTLISLSRRLEAKASQWRDAIYL
jgi:ABC-type nitrate/sulfonate/bicarbonate transport system permease component